MIARIVVLAAALATANAEIKLAFTLSMPQPSAHVFKVALRCDGLAGSVHDFKMPAWGPGYYRILDYATNVTNFRAEDGAGRALAWEQTTKNSWRVVTGGAPAVVLNYDVYGFTVFAAQNYLADHRAYIAPAGMFLHLAGQLQQPVTVTIQLPPNWSRIATGLDAIGNPRTFTAPDFDVLYDSPLLLGNQETLRFDVQGRAHDVALENVPAEVDRTRMLADLKRMVAATVRLMGDMPYRRYAFLMMGTGNGGIEHLNSASIAFNGESLKNEAGYMRWLSYVAHEYFHLFNVKRIRPIALGPFDYDRENLTNLLWVSEGLSVYYQDVLLLRAGLTTREQYLNKLAAAITRFEDQPGRRYQSATESSWNTWGTSGVGGDRNTTISYYDNGAMLGAMLDLKIRRESGNRQSLDDVMRALYRKYFADAKRGFTDDEFRAECEFAAGGSLTKPLLNEVFEYAATTKDVDYAKYFAYAGLMLETSTEPATGVYLGVSAQALERGLRISDVTPGSPAQDAGLRKDEQILEIDGAKATVKVLSDMLRAKKPGERLKFRVRGADASRDVEVLLAPNFKRDFRIVPSANPGALETRILRDWMRRD